MNHKNKLLISIIVPVYNESHGLKDFHDRLHPVLSELDHENEIIFINDGSGDDTSNKLSKLQLTHTNITTIELSRNFGKEVAVTAGLDYAHGDAAIIIDADLQDPPELIPRMIQKWKEGYEVVYARRTKRKGETVIRKIASYIYYRILQHSTPLHIPEDTGDFQLLDRVVIDAIKLVKERHRYMKGLFAWVGYNQTGIEYDRDPRHSGTTSWGFWKLWNFAIEGITSFTTSPLKVATYFGLVTAASSFVFGINIIIDTILHGNPVAGYPSLMVTILFLGGVQLIFIGIIGEYLGRMFDETKKRPLYFIRKITEKQNNKEL